MKKYDKKINKHTDWGGDESTGGLPVAGNRVQEFIKETLGGKMGCIYYQEESNLYLVFADEESRDEYLEDPQTYAENLLGSFEAPAPYNVEINVTSGMNVSVLSGKKGNYITFTFDIKNRSGASVGDSVICTYTFNNNGNKKQVKEIYASGTNVRFLADDYLSDGTTTVSIAIQGQTTKASSMVGVTYKVINLALDSTFNFTKPQKTTESIEVPYSLNGTGLKYVEWIIDGRIVKTDSVSSASVSTTQYLDSSNLDKGHHTLQIRAYITENDVKYYSVTKFFDFVIEGAETVCTLIATTLPSGTLATEPLKMSVTQYETLSIEYGIYDYGYRENAVEFKIGNRSVAKRTLTNNTKDTFVYTPTDAQNDTLKVILRDTEYELELEVLPSSINIKKAVDGCLLELRAKGRSNNDLDKDVWNDRGYSATFNGVQWNAQSGWVNDALVLSNGATMSVDIEPLASIGSSKPEDSGRTIEIEFEATDIEKEDAVICSCKNEGNKAGFEITASKATITSANGIQLETRYRDGDRIKLAFIINKKSGVAEHGLMYIMNNGVIERGINFETTDSFACSGRLNIGNANGDVTTKLYGIRVYSRALSDEEEFGNYAVDSENIIDIANKNDIYDDYGNISYEKVAGKLPVLLITCPDMDKFLAIRDKKTAFYGDLQYIHSTDPTKNFTCVNTSWKKQGTSSLSYPRPNIKFDFSKGTMYDYNGEVLEEGKYSFKDGSAPVNCFTWKADFMESSMSHNTGIARMWNDIMRDTAINGEYVCRTNAQKSAIKNGYPYDVRTTIDGFPAVVFYRYNTSSKWICMGQYNFNNDKSTEEVFGFKDIYKEDEKIFDASNVECWEFLEEDGLCLMDGITEENFYKNVTVEGKEVPNWSIYWEHRYPDDGTKADASKLFNFVSWVSSMKDKPQEFNAQMKDHLDLWKVAGYYIYLMRYCAVDQVTKNAMLTTEDGQHWYFINYDNDTINGLNNSGRLIFNYDLVRESKDEQGVYGYQGHDSVLWNMLEKNAEFMDKVHQLDQAMYQSGLSYAKSIEMFDDKQSKSWCERLVNANTRFKYIDSFISGSNYLYALQGTRSSHRRFFLNKRFNKFDADWLSGAYRDKLISMRCEEISNTSFDIVAGAPLQYGWATNNTLQASANLLTGESHTFNVEALSQGNIVYIYGATSLRKLDLSKLITSISTLDVQKAYNDVDGTKLKSLILGDGEKYNIYVTTISGLEKMVALEELDIRNFNKLTTLDESQLPNLHVYLAEGSGVTSFTPANGAILTDVSLPIGLNAIKLDNTKHTTFSYAPTYSLRSVSMRNVQGINTAEFVHSWYNAINARTDAQTLFGNAELELGGINWEGITPQFMLDIKKFGKLNLQGYVKFASMSYEDYEALKEAYGDVVFQSEGALKFDAPRGAYIKGATSVVGDSRYQYVGVSFPIADNDNLRFRMYDENGTIVPLDSEGKSTYKTMVLDSVSGVLETGIYPEVVNMSLRAENGDTKSEPISLSVEAIVLPTDITIEGEEDIRVKGLHPFSVTLVPSNCNVDVTETSAIMTTQSDYVEVVGHDSEGFTINVKRIPPSTENHNVVFTLRTEHGGFVQKSVNFKVTSIAPTTCTISGVNEIKAKGTYDYTFKFTPEDANIGIKKVDVDMTHSDYITINTREGGFSLNITQIPPTEENLTINVKATTDYDAEFSSSINVRVVSVSPSNATFNPSTITTDRVGSHNIDYAITPSDYNVELNGVEATVEPKQTFIEVSIASGNIIKATVNAIPNQTTDYKIGLNLTTPYGTTSTPTKHTLKVVAKPINDVNFNGDTLITDSNLHHFGFEWLPTDYNIGVESVKVTLVDEEEGDERFEKPFILRNRSNDASFIY